MSKLKITGIIIGVFIGLTAVGFVTGEIQAIYNRTVGVDISSSKTDQFHESKGYIDGMIQDLSRQKLELAQTKDTTARQAIISYINEKFSNFDEKQIKNDDLRQFLVDCRNGNIK